MSAVKPQDRPKSNHPMCGSDSGYYRHIRPSKTKPWKEPACFRCLAAHANATQARYAANPEPERARARAKHARRKAEQAAA